jgi:hypothetical protein
MRLVELFLNETTEEDRAIISLSEPIYSFLQKYADQDLDWDDENSETLYVGKIGQFFDTPFEGIDDIKITIMSDSALLDRIRKENPKAKDAPGGLWDANTRTIIFNADYLSADFMKSTIAHELRHMLDDIKSEFRVAGSKRYSTPKDKEYRKTKNDPYAPDMQYLAQPAEINARFIQVLRALVPKIKRLSSQPKLEARNKLHKMLRYEMDMHDVAGMFRDKNNSSDYKRLLKRGAAFIDKELEHVQQSK